MLILFEGPDSVGKTSISTALAKCLNFKYFKGSREHESFYGNAEILQELQLIYDTSKFLDYIKQGIIENLIIDRDYISQFVYGKIFRKEARRALIETINKSQKIKLKPLNMKAKNINNEIFESIAFNEVSLMRETYHAA